MYIVTGASDNHFRSVLQFLQSLPAAQRERTWVWDFGLSVTNLDSLRKALHSVRLHRFPYEDYPEWFDIRVDAGAYAWKPVAIWRTALEISATSGDDFTLLWCDAGNRLTGGEGGCAALEAVIRHQGVYSPISAGTVRQWTHPACLAWFFGNHAMQGESEVSLLEASPRNGAIIGFDLGQGAAWRLLEEWAALAQQKDCIAPTGSDRSNHRQDQALFTILYYRFTGGKVLCGEPLHLLTHQDVE